MTTLVKALGPQERTTGRLWRALSLAAMVPLVGCWAATQYLALCYHGHPALGWHLNGVYPPWDVFLWAHRWEHVSPALYDQAQTIGYSVAMVASGLMALGCLARRNRFKTNMTLHGSARWAAKKDLRRAGLLRNNGVYVGGWLEKGMLHYLRHNGPEHVLVLAPTRAGKGVSLIIPTLLSWTGSAVVNDPKGELWALTAGWRKEHAGNKALKFEPADPGSCAFNPLAEIRVGTQHEIADAQNLAVLLADPGGKGLDTGHESHWKLASHALLVGCILHLLHESKRQGKAATLPALARMLSDPEKSVEGLWREMIECRTLGGHSREVAAEAAEEQRSRPEKEAGSVLSFARKVLTLYRDPVVAQNVSRSDFRISDLMHHDSPVSLYIITEPVDQARLMPLVRILIGMIVRVLASKLEFEGGQPKPTCRHRLLMLIDELPSLGRLDVLEQSLAVAAGHNIKYFLVAQDLAQILGTYGAQESVTSNCHVQIAFAPNKLETGDHLSRLSGEATIVKEEVSKSGRGFNTNTTRSMKEVQRPLLTVDECMRLPGPEKDAAGLITSGGDMLVFVAGFPAVYGKQPLYFQDPTFKARAAVPPPEQSDVLNAEPSLTPVVP